jgi:prepilin-type N-terminal cleavage/methylation domain-containing protein
MQKERLHINKNRNFKKGFSLVEILVAVSMFLIFVTVTVNIIVNTNKQIQNSNNREKASVLAEEAVEALRNFRDADFTNLIDGTHGIVISGNKWNLVSSPDVTGIFSRVLNISTISPNQKQLDVTVSWADKTSVSNSVSLSSHLTNWRAMLNLGPGLTVNKTVINHGGSKVAADFAPYKVTSTDEVPIETTVTLGTPNLFIDGIYFVSETTDPNYNRTFSGDCDASGSVTMISNLAKTCTITNEEKLAYLIIHKNVINHGGSKVAADFAPYKIDGNTVILNASTNVNSGIHLVSENINTGYIQTFSGDCDSLGSVTLASGETKTCTITNEQAVFPTVTTPTATAITTTTATLGANVTSLGFPAAISERGTCWGTTPAPTTNCVAEGGTTTGVFTQARTGFAAGTTYYYRGYATNATGTAYSADGTFTTTSVNTIPTVTTPTATAITTTTATLGANVTSLGFPAAISARGTCWGITPAPTTNCVAEGGTTTGIFTQARTGFAAGTTYYYRGYATNATGTAYSADGTFTAKAICLASLVGTPTVYNSNNSASALTAKPTGVVSGDIMFAYIMHFNFLDRLSTIPTGWIQIGRHQNGNYNQALYYKVAGASEPTSYTFGLSQNSRFAVTISAYRGCFNTTSPIDISSNVEYVTSNTTYRAGTLNLPSADSTVLMFPSMYDNSVRTFANPTTQSGGWTEDYDHGNTSSRFSRAGYRKFIASPGLTGVIDSIGTTGSTVKHAFAVALHPL